jgi:urease beta subunit
MNKRLYVATHTHRHGINLYFVRSNHLPSDAEIMATTDCDFDPGDELEVTEVGEFNIKDIPDKEVPVEYWQGDSDGTVGVD